MTYPLDKATDADLLLVGGGLANGLIAWRLRQQRPELRVLVVEGGATLGGNHTWSFHDEDLDRVQQRWLAPLVGWRWPGHDVRFPGLRRRFDGSYASIASERFDAVLQRDLAGSLLLKAEVASVQAGGVQLQGGRVLRAGVVLDGRGLPPRRHLKLGWQKFQGLVLRLAAPHGLAVPVLMDATVPQYDGYRFVYLLPHDPCTVLVEETFYADGERLEPERLRASVLAYARAQGWQVESVLREEHGVLPIALDGDPKALWDDSGGVLPTGLSAALFHPTTGYSLPEAARLADVIAQAPSHAHRALHATVRAHALRRWNDQGFYRLLSRLLFQAAEPKERWRVMQRFYGLGPGLIGRFYAGRSTPFDKARVLVGKPPVPMAAAIRAALDTREHRPQFARGGA